MGKAFNYTIRQEKEMVSMYNKGVYLKNIASHFGCSKETMRKIIRKNGILSKPGLNEKVEKRIIKDYESGLTIREIYNKLDLPESKVRLILKKNNIKLRPFASIKYNRIKDNIEEIKDLYLNKGISLAKLSFRYNLSYDYFLKILKRDFGFKVIRTGRWNRESIKLERLKDNIEDIKYLYLDKKWSYDDICKKYDVSYCYLYNFLKNNNLIKKPIRKIKWMI